MNKQHYAIFSCKGLGDGLISLILAHNLVQEGHEATLFHPFLQELQGWFPHIPIRPLAEATEDYDHFFFFYEKLPPLEPLLRAYEKKFKEKICVLNPIATTNTDYPYWENGQFDGHIPFVDNLYYFCKRTLSLSAPTKKNGICIPTHLIKNKYPNRVIIHPTSSRNGKNWSPKKYISLAKKLEKVGFTPAWILTPQEQALWPVHAETFSSLSDLASYIYESGVMIGNDSGIGHLASCLGLRTLTICRNADSARFWRPAWTQGYVLTPPKWLPNLKGLRYRDKYWQTTISVRNVLKTFHRMVMEDRAFLR